MFLSPTTMLLLASFLFIILLPLVKSDDQTIYLINRPVQFEAIVPVKASPGHHVFKLQARTKDPLSHNIYYSLVRDRTGGRFEVDERTGDVRTKGTEPFQLDKEYVIYVRAEDHNRPTGDRTYASTPEHRLSIMGGRRPPQFLLERYAHAIPENFEKDQEVIRVQAQSFRGESITYSMQAKNKGTGTFMIEQNTGIVRLAKELDFEDARQPKLYQFRVNATEEPGGFTSMVDLQIQITDVNDNAPKFERPDYQFYNVLEDVKPGTHIAHIVATDADTGKNAEIEYELDRSEFVIDKQGNIATNRRLDADVNNTYILTVRAKDKGVPSLSGTATVRIYTENTNDEAPKFSQDVYTPNVDENAGPKTLVTTVVASDKDGDNIIFGFAPGSRNPLFQIDERTGVIRLSDKVKITLDKDKYELNVTARDDGKCCDKGNNILHTSHALVVVFITDVNDNKPTFDDCEKYNPQIPEGSPSGSSIITVKASDLDKGHNGMVRYSIVQQPNQKGTKFTIDELTGEVRSNKVFDREGDDGRFVSITVKAVDRGNPPMEGVCSFKVEILDINDNPPLFDRQEYLENVDQDTPIGSQLLRVSASDEDADANGAITYSLQGRGQAASTFSINPDSGWITLEKPLVEKSYSLEAIAMDRGLHPNKAQVAIKIIVIDMGTNPPSWDQPSYEVKIKESVDIGTTILSIKAHSGIPDNPTVFYTLLKGGTDVTNKRGTFYLSPRKEGSVFYADIRTSRHLDYESITSYNLTVRVENDGTHQLASECTIHVMVVDVNDEIPWFTDQGTGTVLEGMPAGTRVTTLRATDADGTSPNNRVFYELEQPKSDNTWERPRKEKGSEIFDATKYFNVDKKTGELFTKVEFDREERQSYNIPVIAFDGAPSDINTKTKAPNSVTHYVRIAIGDKNDNAPYFDRSVYEAEVNEDEDINHTVITVTAKDKDESSKLRYEITKGNIGGGAFAVNNETGAIYVAGPLDYELRKEYKLVLVASDNLNENFTTVVIRVKDVNDNPPIFDRPNYHATIVEGDEKNLPKKILQFNLTLVASDGLHENSTQVRINIKDVNDLPPKFDKQIYITSIVEQSPTTAPILKVTATDGDRDREQNIVYFLGDNDLKSGSERDKGLKHFSINSATGEIYVEKPLDRDAPNGRPTWRFTVYAEDEGGINGLVGYADVLVNLKDINDNTPFFQNAIYYGNVTENSTAGQTVMTMSAIDYDDPNEDKNAKLKYAIEQNAVLETGDLIFKIDEDTGVIQTAVCCLDREAQPEYSIKVTATDGGGQAGSVQAVIKIKDINDMPPSFAKEEYNVEVDETDGDILPTLPILVATVNDADLLETNRFTYRILERDIGYDKFSMVTNADGTGSLKVAKPLDYEDPAQRYGFNLTIEVNDHGGEPGDSHVDTARVKVRLRDINDNKPIFDPQSIEVSVPEDAPVTTLLAEFKARDPDQNGLSKVKYAIDRSSDREKHFVMDPVKGLVRIQRMLDRESVSRHIVKILAIDDGVPAKTASTTLTVIVTDINDNAPKLSKDERLVIRENLPPNQKLEGILATDPDDKSAGNGFPFHYMLDPTAPDIIKNSFEVHHDTSHWSEGAAVVISKVSFDREVQKEYHIPIIIRDSGRAPKSLTGTSTLTVVIGDINDNKMHPGSKTIFVYNYQGANYRNIPIGRVHVEDNDDWDLPDKSFRWQNTPHSNFELNPNNGTIFMKNVTEGTFFLKFQVIDKMHTQDVPANVTVVVKNLPEEAVYNSGSLRISGITDEDFIRVWDWKSQRQVQSKYDLLRETLSKILKESTDNIDIFSVMTTYRKGVGPETDVRFAAHGSPYHKSTFLDGYVGLNIHAISQELGVNITMVNIDECLTESADKCDGSCSNTLDIAPYPYVVNANRTSFVGVHSKVVAKCECKAKIYNDIDPDLGCKVYPPTCHNGGRCVLQGRVATCVCPEGYDGPQCQITSRTFSGDGSWAWFPPLEQCEDSHLSIEFMTETPNGLILYNGPIAIPVMGTQSVEDFISLELSQGKPKLIIDFGSGTSQIYIDTTKELNDGEWHHIDIFWTREEARMVIDYCVSATFSDISSKMDRSNCEGTAMIEPYNQFLNLNTPLQLGGIFHNHTIADSFPGWKHNDRHTQEHFKGCIRNLIHNSKMYDLGSAGGSIESTPRCQISQERCQADAVARQCDHGHCEANYRSASCICRPGFIGAKCDTPAPVKMFQSNSYIKYALSFDPNSYKTDIQMNFRTRQKAGELIRLPGKNAHQHLILELKDRNIRFRMQLDYRTNNIKQNEIELTLQDIIVSDGQWHTVRATRFGSTASLSLDGGGGKKYNETMQFEGYNQVFIVNKQSISIGGDISYIGPASYYVENGLIETCVSDIRIDQRHLPLENGSENAAVVESRGLKDGCHPENPCGRMACPPPLTCVDMWNLADCQCPTGWIPTEDGNCTDDNECLNDPCNNGGTCLNLDNGQGFYCDCPEEFVGDLCNALRQERSLSMGSLAQGLAQANYDSLQCVDYNECFDRSCGNGGICHNIERGGGFYCECPYPDNMHHINRTCDDLPIISYQPQYITLGGHAVMAILICILISPLFTLSRSNRLDQKFGPSDADDDVRENIISYDDEGGGEDDMHAYDITPLRIPVDASGTPISTVGKQVLFNKPGILKDMRPRYPQEYHPTGDLMDPKVRAINADDDIDPTSQPSDDLRNYAYEGCGSTAGSLSSLASIGEGEQDQNFDYLNRWGPRFKKLAYLYGPPETDED